MNLDQNFIYPRKKALMQEFFEKTRDLIFRIREFEEKTKRLASYLKENLNFFENIHKINLDSLKVCGVDGGLVKRSFHGIDLILLRSVGVSFQFKESRLWKVEYFPSPHPLPSPQLILDPLSELDFELEANIRRQISEIETALSCLKIFKPDILLLDGSIIPHYTFQPSKDSFIFESFKRMVEKFNEFFEEALRLDVLVAGVIKDSRGKRFCDVVASLVKNLGEDSKVLLERIKDSHILSYILRPGEKTLAFNYSSNPSSNPLLRNFFVKDRIKGFYMRSGEFDRPIRVDFLEREEGDDKKIASIILSLIPDPNLGIPSILIEADRMARLKEDEIDMLHAELFSQLATFGLLEKRRNRKPF